MAFDGSGLERRLQRAQRRWRLEHVELVRAHVRSKGRDAIALDDLLLAGACAVGEPRALAHLEARLRAPSLLPRRLAGDDEFHAELRTHLLVKAGDRPPRIAEYSGRGPLTHWLRVVASRLERSRQRRDRPRAETALPPPMPSVPDPERLLRRRQSSAVLEPAFARAFATLPETDRTLLEQRFAFGVPLAELARHAGVHPITISKRQRRALDALRAALVSLEADTDLATLQGLELGALWRR